MTKPRKQAAEMQRRLRANNGRIGTLRNRRRLRRVLLSVVRSAGPDFDHSEYSAVIVSNAGRWVRLEMGE